MSAPHVSVLIPAYNAASYLPHSLQSVLRQRYEDWEAVVIDDGSTDETRTVIEAYAPLFKGRLRYVYQSNLGLPAARNAAMRIARGAIFALLDADDVWLENRLEETAAALDGDKSISLVHARIARINITGEVIDYPPGPAGPSLSGHTARDIYTHRLNILCPTATFRRVCIERVGGFDERMRATEDRDMWFRIAERFAVRYVDAVVAHYRISPKSMSADWTRMWTAQMYFLNKHLERGAVSRSAYREALATVCRARGNAHLSADEFQEALRCYARSIRMDPLSAANWYALLRAVGRPVLRLGRFR
jgi:glycosyltransferase involved in cell wall biosynthesis